MDIYLKKDEKAVLSTTYVVEGTEPRKRIRLANVRDYSAILSIYAPYIIGTTITFEYDVPSEEEFAQRMAVIAATYPILVLELDGEIIGYAYSAVFKPRAAYQWTTETVIYLHQNYARKGFGRPLYEALIEVLKLQRICQAIGVITSENNSSLEFHRHLGFVQSAKLEKVGYKFGKWLDVEWMQYQFNELLPNPEPIIPINEIANSSGFSILMTEINRKLNF